MKDWWKTDLDAHIYPPHRYNSHACRSAVSSCVKSTTKPWATPHHYYLNERSLAPQVHTQLVPGPAPLPPLFHTPHIHTHNGHSRARGPTMQFHHTKDTHQSLSRQSEKKKRTMEVEGEKTVTLEGGLEVNGWNTKAGQQKEYGGW